MVLANAFGVPTIAVDTHVFRVSNRLGLADAKTVEETERQLQKAIPQATPKMLSSQLKELEASGIVERVLYPVVPPKTEYSLTEFGKTLVPIVVSLRDWGNKYFDRIGEPNPCKVRE